MKSLKLILLSLFVVAGISNSAFGDAMFTMRTTKVGDTLIGVTSYPIRVAQIICNTGVWSLAVGRSAEMFFPTNDGVIASASASTSPSMVATRPSAHLPLDPAAVEAICSGKQGEFDIKIHNDRVELIGQPRAATAESWPEVRSPY